MLAFHQRRFSTMRACAQSSETRVILMPEHSSGGQRFIMRRMRFGFSIILSAKAGTAFICAR